jgi:hypothetical protein
MIVLVHLVTLIFFAFLSIWIMQNSVNAYFQQTYHRESPLSKLEKSEYRSGDKPGL